MKRRTPRNKSTDTHLHYTTQFRYQRALERRTSTQLSRELGVILSLRTRHFLDSTSRSSGPRSPTPAPSCSNHDLHLWARRLPMTTRSEEHTSELQSLMRISYAVFCLNKTKSHFKYPLTLRHSTHHATKPTTSI